MATRWYKTKELLKIIFIIPALSILILLKLCGLLKIDDDEEED